MLKVYFAIVHLMEDLVTMLNAINTLNKSLNKGEDKRSAKLVRDCFDEVVEAIQHDLEMLDKELYSAAINEIKSTTAKANYVSLEQAVDKIMAVL